VRLERGAFYNKGKKRSLTDDQKNAKKVACHFLLKTYNFGASKCMSWEKFKQFLDFSLILI